MTEKVGSVLMFSRLDSDKLVGSIKFSSSTSTLC